MKLNSVYLKFLVVFTLVFATSFLNAQWIQQTNMVGPARSGAVSWVLNNKLYVVGGGPGQSLQEFDPATGGWMVKTALPWGAAYRYLGVGFTISGKGYICTGTDGAGGYTTDLWMYDPGTNAWAAKSAFPGAGRVLGFGFSIGNKAYVGAGGDNQVFFRDMYEYSAVTNSWTAMPDFPGGYRAHVLGSAVGNYGYAGAGVEFLGGNFINHSDLFRYDPAGNSWAPLTSIPGPDRLSGSAFASSTHLYAGFGGDNQNPNTSNNFTDLYKYDPLTDVWDTLPQFPTARAEATGAFLNNKVYVATGRNRTTSFGDLWTFDEQTGPVTAIAGTRSERNTGLFPNPANRYFEFSFTDEEVYDLLISNALGEIVRTLGPVSSHSRVDCSFLANGLYTVRLSTAKTTLTLKLIVDHQ